MAIKRRWYALPEPGAQFGFSAETPWTFPVGSVWVKHFDLETERGNSNSASRRRPSGGDTMPTDWEAQYQKGETPWEKGAPSPGLVDFLAG